MAAIQLKTVLRVFLFALLATVLVHSGLSPASAFPLVGKQIQLGPLSTLLVENVADAPYVIYLHGWGGTGENAFESLRPEIEKSDVLRQVNWIFPDAKGSWFDILTEDQLIWQKTIAPSRKQLQQLVAALKKRRKIGSMKIIWAGFSQGGITAADFVLHAKPAPLALIVNSGIEIRSPEWKRRNPLLRNIPFFLSHDRQDDVLPFDRAEGLEGVLVANGMKGHLESHSEGHAIPAGFFERAIREILSTGTF